MYDILKCLHIVGVILLVGNVTVSAVWKVFADRGGNPAVIAHAQRLVTITDLSLTVFGILLTMTGGYGVAFANGLHPLTTPWLVQGQVLFAASGAIWLFILIPIQIRQARYARMFQVGGDIPEQYRKDCRRWLFWGIVATLPLVIAVYVMVAK